MERMVKMEYYTVEDITRLLGKSQTTAYRKIAIINSKIQNLGKNVLIENGRVPVDIFHMYYPYIPRL
ncbi:MAG: hypothetical protein ACRC0V_05655, partial [Fusobacteriaceae bacterium]